MGIDIQATKKKLKKHAPDIAVVTAFVAGVGVLVYMSKRPKTVSEEVLEGVGDLEQAIVLFKEYGFPLFYDADNPSVFYDIQRVPQEVVDNIA